MLAASDIVAIEAAAYPAYMVGMDDCTTMKDIAAYVECKPRHMLVLGTPNHWYCLAARHNYGVEIVDFACMPGKIPPVFAMITALRAFAKGKALYCDARQSTSYKLLQLMAARRRISMTVLDTWQWGNDRMMRCEIA